MKALSIILSITFTLLLSGCNTIPKVIQGEFSTITPAQSKTNHSMNENIRWSGYIVQTINNKDKTCFEIVETETYNNLSPKRIIPKNGGRFMACKDGFLEPTAFDKRLVTITGNIVAYTEQNIGDYQYEYPVIQTDKIYIWRKDRHYNYSAFNNSYFAHRHISRFSCHYSRIAGYCYP